MNTKEEKKYAYIRVSSKDQHEDRQIDALKEYAIPAKNIYIDKQSGKDFDRTGYQELVKNLDIDCTLFIKSIDRLGRNYDEIIEQWHLITKEIKADIVVLDMPLLDTRHGKDLLGTFLADVVLSLLSYVAENERANIRQRQAEGIAAAKARGKKFGRPQRSVPDNFHQMAMLYRKKRISLTEAAKQCEMPRSTFYYKCQNQDPPPVNIYN